MTGRLNTTGRLSLGLGALVLLLVLASGAAILGSIRIHRGVDEAIRREEGVRLSLALRSEHGVARLVGRDAGQDDPEPHQERDGDPDGSRG